MVGSALKTREPQRGKCNAKHSTTPRRTSRAEAAGKRSRRAGEVLHSRSMSEDEDARPREVAAANGDVPAEISPAEDSVETTQSERGIAVFTEPQPCDAKPEPPAATVDSEIAVDEREVLFLVANYLEKREESRHAAQALIADLSTSDLLGESVSWDGRPKLSTYADYKRRHRDLGPDHLLHILKGALAAKANAAGPPASVSLLLKSRVMTHRQALKPEERKTIQTEIISKSIHLRKLQRTEAVVTRIVRKFDRLVQFLEDSNFDSLPEDVRQALQESTTASVNVTALAADVRAVRQLLQVREEKAALHTALLQVLEHAQDVGALQSSARTGRNHLHLLHRREVSMKMIPRLPPTYIYSRFRRLKTLNGHLQIPTYCMTYDKTGKFVITGADDRLIKIWSLHTGDLCFTLRGHVGNITDLAVNHSNTLLASSSDDKTVRVWELSTGAPVAVLLGHSSVVNSVRFHPSKNIVVTASDDGHCFCYKLPDIAKFDEPESKEQTAKRLLEQGAYLLTLRPAYSLSHAANRPNVRSNKVLCLNFSRCGNYVVTGGQDGLGRVWDVSELCDSNGQVAATDFRVSARDTIGIASPPPVAQTVTQAEEQIPDEIAISPPAEIMEDIVVPPEPQIVFDVADAPDEQTAAVAEPSPALVPPVTIPLNVPIAEVRQQPQLAEVQQSRQAVVDIDQVHRINEPIAFLKGHTGPVTNILFSYRGDKIATSSIKDGTTRVWKWEKKYKKISHTVLFSQERDRERELEMLYGISTRKKAPPAVDTLVWTRNDKRLITLHSTKPASGTGEGDWRQRMRVWDPETGSLEMTLAAVDSAKKNGHVNAVFAMDVHPTDWRIVVTAGHDGRVFLWDISEGRILKSFVVTSPEGETVALLDGSFMPTGDGFCFTDRIGRLCIFGTGSGEQFATVPVQQYFYSDYAALVTDRHFHVIDRETQRAPSLMESGPVMDIFRIQYPHQPPHLLASHGALTQEQYEENRRKRVQQCIESENACKVRHDPHDEELADEESFPSAIVKPPSPVANVSSAASPRLATGAYRLNGDAVLQAEILRRATWNRQRRAELQSRRRTSSTSDERDTSILNVDISSEDDHSDEDFQISSNRRAGEDDGDEDDEDDDDDDDDESELDEDDVPSDSSEVPDGERLRRRRARQNDRQMPGRGRRLDEEDEEDPGESTERRLRRRRPVPRRRLIGDEEDEGEIEIAAEGSDLRLTRARSRSHSVETLDSAPDAVVVESNDGFIMGDNHLDKFDATMTYEEMVQAKRDQVIASGGNPDETPLIVCALCGEGDDQGLLKLPGEAIGRHPLISGTQRLFVHDQCAIASPLCFNRGGKWYNLSKEVRRGRSLTCVECKKRGATIGCTLERCPRSYHWKCAVTVGWSLDQIQFFCPEHAPRTNGQGQANGGPDDEIKQRFGLLFHREWLQLSSLVGMHPYVPQRGDYVVYFPEGHTEFLNATTMKEPAFMRQLSRYVSLKCNVADVKYHFPSMTVYKHGDVGQKAIQCEVTLAILAVPAAAFPSQTPNEEQKEEVDGDIETIPEPTTLFNSEAPFFSKFVSVNHMLQPTSDSQCERLKIKLRTFSNDVSNFLVLDHVYDAGISGSWKVGQRIRSPLIDLRYGLQTSSKTSFGTIDAIKVRESTANPAIITPWNSIFVRWDASDEDDCYVSPWELEPASAAETSLKKERERQLQSVGFHKSRRLSQQQRSSLSEVLSGVMSLDIAKDFVHPVPSEYADYMVTIANPIDLTRIRARVENGYYRQLDAFIADVDLLLANCETYNVSTSAIAQNARSLVSSILTSLQQLFPDFFTRLSDPNSNVRHYPPIDNGINEDDEPDVDDGSYEEERQIEDAMTALDELPLLTSEPESVQTPPRLTRSSRSTVEPSEANELEDNEHLESPTNAPVPETPQRRPKRERGTPITSPEPPKSARKRQRPAEDRVLTFGEVLSQLTADQRELYEARAADDLVSLLRDFHEALIGADTYEVFASPVTDEIAPGYSSVIRKPMDFGTILDSIDMYARFSRYFEDVELVFRNAITFNGWDSGIGAVVKELQGVYVKFLLDAIGATPKQKQKTRGGSRLGTQVDLPSRGRANGAPKRKRAISDDEEEEESWGSDESGSDEEEEDDESEDDEVSEDDDESEPESDWSDKPRRRRLTRGGSKKPKSAGKKKKKKSKKATHKSKRGRPSRR